VKRPLRRVRIRADQFFPLTWFRRSIHGQLAYVYLPNTGQPGYTSFNRYYFAQQDKKGAIIDERYNGGGSAADYIIGALQRDFDGRPSRPFR
jgi:C-terminal processing protease CtpA/Prc